MVLGLVVLPRLHVRVPSLSTTPTHTPPPRPRTCQRMLSPLLSACQHASAGPIVMYLLDRGANVEYVTVRNPPLNPTPTLGEHRAAFQPRVGLSRRSPRCVHHEKAHRLLRAPGGGGLQRRCGAGRAAEENPGCGGAPVGNGPSGDPATACGVLCCMRPCVHTLSPVHECSVGRGFHDCSYESCVLCPAHGCGHGFL